MFCRTNDNDGSCGSGDEVDNSDDDKYLSDGRCHNKGFACIVSFDSH